MKILTTLLLTMTVSFSVNANRSLTICNEVNKLSKGIMEARQSGAEMQKVVQVVNESFSDEVLFESVMAVVKAAYSLPVYTDFEARKLMINEFSNEIYLQCLNYKQSEKG